MRVRRAFLTSCASWSALAVIAGGISMMPATARAQEADASTRDFNIPAGDLATVLGRYSSQAGLQLVYSSDLVAGLKSAGVSGRMTAQEALARILSGTGLSSTMNGNSVTLLRVDAAGGERVLGAVRVQGAQGAGLPGATVVNGVNGSRDVTATEGTGSYTSNALTVGSKTAQSIKDTAMAVSVITSQRMQDQNITDLNSAMRDAPGISVLHDTANDLQFYSRGFRITQMQVDGGAAQNFMANTSFYRPIIDMSLYDHVEIVRGATGTFNAYGDPGGVLNLVRKRPLDHPQMLLDMQLGSWDWHRISADVTGPLGFNGKLRGRLIATHQDNQYFYDVAKANRNVISGTLELDVTPTTLVTAGVNYQEQGDTPWNGGLMRYQTGKTIPFPRSTCLCFPWANSDRDNLELYGQIDQKIGTNWSLKLKATKIRQHSFADKPSVRGAIDPASGLGAKVSTNALATHGQVRQSLLEATLDGSFQLFGQAQKIIIGANYSMFDPSGSYDSVMDYSKPIFVNGQNDSVSAGNIRKFDPYAWQPVGLYPQPGNGWEFGDYRYLNAYATLEITPLAHLHINTGIRYSTYRDRSLIYYMCSPQRVADPDFTECFGKSVGYKGYFTDGQLNKGGNFSWPPSIQMKYDINNNLAAYAAYTDIYVNRSSYITKEGLSLPPTTGSNYEVGIKWLSPNRMLNVTLSGYYTKQINTDSVSDPFDNRSTTNIGQLNQQIYCCYRNVDGAYNLSYGGDLEVTGEIARGWQMSASYTYNFNKSKRPDQTYFDGSDQLLISLAPRHLFKLWSSYEFDDRSHLSGLRLGFGVSARSKTFVADSYCPQDPISTPNGPQCPVSRTPVFFSDPGYVVFSGSVGYKINEKLHLYAEFENLLDKTYFEQVGGISGGNWYGAPRSVKVTLRGKF